MPQTPNHGYNVPNEGAQDWHEPLNLNFRQYDTDIEIRDTDANKGSYEPKQGAKFLATDTGTVYEGDGGNWRGLLAQYRFSKAATSGAAGNLVAGHPSNSVGNGVSGGTISGGGTANRPNRITASFATVGGGEHNSASGGSATVGGGFRNVAGGEAATVGGGEANEVVGSNATVSGGARNKADDAGASVGGGVDNWATAKYATAPGGRNNVASGEHSFAAGRGAEARVAGTFVWGDSTSNGVTSTKEDEFKVQAGGGAVVFSASDHSAGVNLAPGAGSWSSWSSRTAKENVEPAEPRDVLARVRALDVATWNYTAQDDAVRHMGPMAEEFHDELGLGGDRERITSVDADGVALAAIQGLADELDATDGRVDDQAERIADQAERIADQAERIADQAERIDALERENEALRTRLAALERHVDPGTASTDGPARTDD